MTRISDTLLDMTVACRREALAKCCAATAWVDAMLQGIPFASDAELETSAARIWNKLTREDWLEAFAAHPKIGDLNSLRAKYASTQQWAAGEQSGVGAADDHVLSKLAEHNRIYEERFGYLFIVCATGKTAEEMLQLLLERQQNAPDQELLNAAAEQLKITLLRLRKLAP